MPLEVKYYTETLADSYYWCNMCDIPQLLDIFSSLSYYALNTQCTIILDITYAHKGSR